MKYKVGDKVRVKPLKEFKKACRSMCININFVKHLAGQVVTIESVNMNAELYRVEEDYKKFFWDNNCFVGLAEEPFTREECSEEDTVKWQKANPNLPDTKKWPTYPVKVDGEQLLRARELIESELSIPSEPRPLVEVLKDKVSELETRVSDLERKLEQMIRDA